MRAQGALKDERITRRRVAQMRHDGVRPDQGSVFGGPGPVPGVEPSATPTPEVSPVGFANRSASGSRDATASADSPSTVPLANREDRRRMRDEEALDHYGVLAGLLGEAADSAAIQRSRKEKPPEFRGSFLTTSTSCHEIAQAVSRFPLPEAQERAIPELPDPLAGDAHHAADLLEGAAVSVVQPEIEPQHLGVPCGKDG